MGVSGSGKTTVGQLLAEKLGVPFYDGDDFHPAANVEKMSFGVPLTDDDRKIWLAAINRKIREHVCENTSAIFACSALKADYRRQLSEQVTIPLRWVYLHGDYQTIQERMQRRKDHFMPASLLTSQFAILEEPQDALVINIVHTPQKLVDKIISSFPN